MKTNRIYVPMQHAMPQKLCVLRATRRRPLMQRLHRNDINKAQKKKVRRSLSRQTTWTF